MPTVAEAQRQAQRAKESIEKPIEAQQPQGGGQSLADIAGVSREDFQQPSQAVEAEGTYPSEQRDTEPIQPRDTNVSEVVSRAMESSRIAPQPEMHPGSSNVPFILNMENGKLEGQPDDGFAALPGASRVFGANELRDQSVPSYPVGIDTSAPEYNGMGMTAEQAKKSVANDAERMRRMSESQYDNETRRQIQTAGRVSEPLSTGPINRSNRIFDKIRKLFMDDQKKHEMAGPSYSGVSFIETLFSKADLMPHCVSIGTENLIESLREPNSTILDIVNYYLRKDALEQPLTREECLADIRILVDIINRLNIEVVLDKKPVNVNHSIQVRTLRVHYGRGIGLHPTQTKAYNADYDGDPAQLNLDQTQIMRYAKAMDRLVAADGTPMIDPDFFPLEPFSKEDKKEVLYLLKMRNMSWNPRIAEEIIDAYDAACNKGDWVTFLRKIDELAQKYASGVEGDTKNEVASGILMSMYEFSLDRRAWSVKLQFATLNDGYSNENDPVPNADPFVLDLCNMYDEILAGRPCPSLIEFVKFYSRYYGDVKGKDGLSKNVPFRLLADFGKAINRTDLISIGSDLFGFKLEVSENAEGETTFRLEDDPEGYVSIYDLWQFTCVAALTKEISGRTEMGSHKLAVSTQVRAMLLKDMEKHPIGSWGNDVAKFRAWIKRFREMYNINMRMLNLAQVSFRGGGSLVREDSYKFDGIGENYEGLAEALIKVYGQYTVGAMFPSLIGKQNIKDAVFGNVHSEKKNPNQAVIPPSVARRYRNMPIEMFAMDHKITPVSENGKPLFSQIKNRLANGTFDMMDVLVLISDHRSKQLGRYRKQWDKTTKELFEAVQDMYGYRGQEYNEYASSIMNIIQLMSPEMFKHFGMISPSTFAHSKWGKRLLGAKSLEEFRTHLVGMMVEYRLGKASSILDELEEESLHAHEGNYEILDKLDAAFENEMEVLGSSSMVWRAITSEMKSGNKIFKSFMKTKGVPQDKKQAGWLMHGHITRRTDAKGNLVERGVQFWDRPSISEKYYSLIDLLRSSEPVEVKVAVLTDIVKVNENYSNVDPKEILGQLAYHPDRIHAGNRFDMDKGVKSDIDALKESSDRLSSYRKKTPDKIRAEARKVLDIARKNKREFEHHLQRLASDPGYAVHIDPLLAADAIASVYDKTYDDTEKIKQQARVNGYFGCVSLQRSGGFFTHLCMTDNAVVNAVGFDQISPQDIVRLLADPTVTIMAYDDFGTPAILSRKTICHGNTIDDVIKYLEKHPRVALSCRRFMAGIGSDVDGTARLNAMNDRHIGDKISDRVFALLDDRPRFLAVAALLTPGDNKVGRMMPDRIAESIEYLCNFIYAEAGKMSGGIQDIDTFRKDLANELGLSEEALLAKHVEGRFDPSDISDEDRSAVSDLYSEIENELSECIDLIGAVFGTSHSTSYPKKPKNFGVDKSSLIAYYDVRQQISGARTAMMIGIEGSETKKNLVLKQYLRSLEDEYTMSSNGMVIPLVEGLDQASDQSLVSDESMMLGSVAKFLEIYREAGAETFNAKYKKYGDDGSNSMIKFIHMAKKAVFDRYGKGDRRSDDLNGIWTMENGDDLMARIHACPSKADAVPILASALMEADIRLGYIKLDKRGFIADPSFTESDYWNRAALMIGENSDGSLVVRTLEQIAVACRNRLSNEAVISGSAKIVNAEIEQIVRDLGTDRDRFMKQNPDEVAFRCLTNAPIHSSIGDKYRIDRALQPRESSAERNYSLLRSIMRDFYKYMKLDLSSRTVTSDELIDRAFTQVPERRTEVLESRKLIDKRSEYKFGQLHDYDKDLAKALRGIVFPYDKYDSVLGEYVENDDRKYIYDYLGMFSDKDLELSPGPTSMILFDGDFGHIDNSVFNARLEQCKRFGITAIFPGNSPALSLLEDEDLDQLVKVCDDKKFEGLYILPCFDIALNGVTGGSIMPAPTEVYINPSNAVVNAEDIVGEFAEGDSSYHITKELADRIKVKFRGSETFSVTRLFPNVLASFGKSDFSIDYCSREEIEKYIMSGYFNPETLTMDGFNKAVVDIGVHPSNRNFEHEKQRFALRLEEYKANFGRTNENGIIEGDCRYDSIIGFVKINDLSNGGIVLAPIWPFHLEESGMIPTTFSTTDFKLSHETSSFILDWMYSGNMEGQYIKAFEGIGASTKLIAGPDRAKSRTLENGIAIDGFYSTATVASRLFPSNKRIATIISAMMMTRLDPRYSYNFADLADSFPGNPVIKRPNGEEVYVKEALADNLLGITDWQLIKDANIVFHPDQKIDSIVRFWVDKCLEYGTVNPSTLLATKTTKGVLWPKITEFEAFMDTGYKFQEAWMNLMHTMCKTLVPSSIDASEKEVAGCLFKPVNSDKSDKDYGVLQMVVPYWDSDGQMAHVLENVYISMGFFGDEFSGFKRVNFSGKRRNVDNLNVASGVDGDDLKNLLTFARSAISQSSTYYVQPTTDVAMFETFPRYIDEPVTGKRKLSRKQWGKTLALTGHRPGFTPRNYSELSTSEQGAKRDKLWGYARQKNPQYDYVASQLRQYCIDHHIDTIISGMALGFDSLGAEVAKSLGLKLVAAVPFRGQEARWKEWSQGRYSSILQSADQIVYVNETANAYSEKYDSRQTSKWLQDRNKWMIDNADAVFALWDGSDGGTGNAVSYAYSKNRPTHILKPSDVDEAVGLRRNDDGQHHVNVYSKSNDKVGRFLSNFAKTPLSLPEGDFMSIEGYWHYLGLPENCKERDKLKSLFGPEARSVGRALRKKYGTVKRADFKEKIRHAIHAKLYNNYGLWSNSPLLGEWMTENGKKKFSRLPLEHYYVKGNGDVDNQDQFKWLLDVINDEMDKVRVEMEWDIYGW